MRGSRTSSAFRKTSYEVDTIRVDTGPQHKRLLRYFNDMHEARAACDIRTMHRLESVVPPILDEFIATECQSTANPAWLSAKMRAGWYVALGDFETALAFEQEGYSWADREPGTGERGSEKAHRKSISASNIADQLWRLDRADEGLPWAQFSVQLWPSNSINYLVLAITLFHVGLHREADELVEELRQIANLSGEQGLLSVCMSFESGLKEMIELPAVNRLLQDMNRAWSSTCERNQACAVVSEIGERETAALRPASPSESLHATGRP